MIVTSESQLAVQFQYGFDHEALSEGNWQIDYMDLDNTLSLYFCEVDDTDVLVFEIGAPGKGKISFLGMRYDAEAKSWLSPEDDGGLDIEALNQKCADFYGIPLFAFTALVEIAVHRIVDEVDHYVNQRQATTLLLDEEMDVEADEFKEELSRSLCIWKMPYYNPVDIELSQDGVVNIEELYEGDEDDEQIGLYVLTV